MESTMKEQMQTYLTPTSSNSSSVTNTDTPTHDQIDNEANLLTTTLKRGRPRASAAKVRPINVTFEPCLSLSFVLHILGWIDCAANEDGQLQEEEKA